MKRRNKSSFLRSLFFILGLFCLSVPFLGSLKEAIRSEAAILSYQKEIEQYDGQEREEIVKKIRHYNTKRYCLGNFEAFDVQEYHSLFSFESKMFAYLDIPSIDMHLPIFQGIDEEFLQQGAGHVPSSSLPIGGSSTRALLTGHSGLSSGKLFSRLDELREGDSFFIQILDQELRYRIHSIEVIRPEETQNLAIVEGKDLVSLITCTPYGLNTHRLVVTGERVDGKPEEKIKIKKKIPSVREWLVNGLPFLVGIGWWIRRKKDE